ncbi:MAG: hypothetical protein ABEJ35_00365 [Halobacteriaceae archaeon]
MTSLSEAYERQAIEVSRRRLYLGTGLFAAGAVLLVGGILAGTTTLAIEAGFGVGGARELAGVLAGLGIPAVLVGVFTVLPATNAQRAGAAIGAGIAVLGVALFRYTYPEQWYVGESGIPSSLTLSTTITYFAGTVVTLWFLFTAVATFKRRNDPGGTVTLQIERGGVTKTVEVAAKDAAAAKEAFGGVGISGMSEEDTVPTQTGPGPSASDGGTTTQDVSSPNDGGEVMQEETPDEGGTLTDKYCGNCEHFDYVRTEEGIQPYCGYHDELMDDMEACSEWAPRGGENAQDIARLD